MLLSHSIIEEREEDTWGKSKDISTPSTPGLPMSLNEILLEFNQTNVSDTREVTYLLPLEHKPLVSKQIERKVSFFSRI